MLIIQGLAVQNCEYLSENKTQKGEANAKNNQCKLRSRNNTSEGKL